MGGVQEGKGVGGGGSLIYFCKQAMHSRRHGYREFHEYISYFYYFIIIIYFCMQALHSRRHNFQNFQEQENILAFVFTEHSKLS